MEEKKQSFADQIKSGFNDSLNPRTKIPMSPENNDFMRVLCMISPVIIYMLYVSLLSSAGRFLVEKIAQGNESASIYIAENGTVINMIIRIVSITVATIMQIPALLGEQIVLLEESKACVRHIIRGITAGISTALLLNIFIQLIGLTKIDGVYRSVAQKPASLPFAGGLLLYSLLSPVAEEVVFRGLIYNRMRRNIGLILSLIMSSVFFGLYHMNMVQGLYGFLMGLLIAWIYERYGGFMYPVIVHASANMSIFIISRTDMVRQKVMTPAVLIITGVISVYSIYRIGSEKIKS